MQTVNPPELGRARGFSHGLVAPAGTRLLFVAGQTAADDAGRVSDQDFVAQFAAALDKVLHVVRAAGATATDVARMTIYVTDMKEYRRRRRELGALWQARMNGHYPAMALVQVSGLVDEDAAVEIQADVVIR